MCELKRQRRHCDLFSGLFLFACTCLCVLRKWGVMLPYLIIVSCSDQVVLAIFATRLLDVLTANQSINPRLPRFQHAYYRPPRNLTPTPTPSHSTTHSPSQNSTIPATTPSPTYPPTSLLPPSLRTISTTPRSDGAMSLSTYVACCGRGCGG